MKRKAFALMAALVVFSAPAWAKMAVFNLAVEPRTVDPVLNNAVDGSNVISNIFEGLLRVGADDSPEPGCAERWDVSDDGLTYTFHLRPGLKWSDGSPLVADDFVYGFSRVVDPANASPYAYLGFCIKNGEAVYKGKADMSTLGLEAPDERTLVMHLQYKTPLLLDYLSYHLFYPAKRTLVEADPRGWTLANTPLPSNGPFYLTEWRHNSELTVKRNPYYWDADNVKLEGVRMVMIGDSNTALAAFTAGKVDFINQLPPLMTAKLIAEGKATVAPTLGTSFTVFNTAKPPFDNPLVRRAFTLAVDRQALVNKVTQGGQLPAGAFLPPGLPSSKGAEPDFRTEDGTEYLPTRAAPDEARELMAQAGYPGGKGFPRVTYLYNTNPTNKALAEALQAMWKSVLGVDVTLEQQEWKVFIDSRLQKKFDLARHAYLSDFFDPASLLELWVSDNSENVASYHNADYDTLMKNSLSETDRAKRFTDLHRAEALLLKDLPVLPLYYYATPVMCNPKLKGVVQSPRNWVFFRGATFQD